MSIQSELNRISNAKNDIANAIRSKGVDLSASVSFDDYPIYVNKINYIDPAYTFRVYNGSNLVSCSYSPTGDCGRTLYNGNITNIVCGNKVSNISYSIMNCTSTTTHDFVCGPNVTDISVCFSNANIGGNHYYNNCTKITNADYIYESRSSDSTRINIFTTPSTQNIILDSLSSSTYSIFGFDYTMETVSSIQYYCYYVSDYNLYVYASDYWESSGGIPEGDIG